MGTFYDHSNLKVHEYGRLNLLSKKRESPDWEKGKIKLTNYSKSESSTKLRNSAVKTEIRNHNKF